MSAVKSPVPLLLRLSGETDALRTVPGDCAMAGIGVMCLCGAADGIIACSVLSLLTLLHMFSR
jgi:TRAP-type mannitol/chloroaromatic compound transport system permease large subunit